MSGSLAVSIIGGELNRLLFGAQRDIGGIQPMITINETHRDDLAITRHPVEQGAAITDHSYLEPFRCEMKIGYSDVGILNGPGYTKRMYNKLLALQASRTPISVTTGKRLYTNMLIATVGTETAEGFENSSIINVRLQQVILVQTGTTDVPAKADQATPATTQPPGNGGTVNPVTPPAPRVSILQGTANTITGGRSSFNAEAPAP